MDIALAIDSLVPQAQYGGSVTSNTKKAYDATRWEDERPKPSWLEIIAAQEAIDVALPLNEWAEAMAASDVWMSRSVEDVIDALDSTTRNKIAAETLDKYNDKKLLRSQKPV